MKCNLIVEINEITIRDFTLIEDEGIICLLASQYPNLSFEYEDDEEKPGKYILVIKGATLEALFKFLSFSEIPVKVIN